MLSDTVVVQQTTAFLEPVLAVVTISNAQWLLHPEGSRVIRVVFGRVLVFQYELSDTALRSSFFVVAGTGF